MRRAISVVIIVAGLIGMSEVLRHCDTPLNRHPLLQKAYYPTM